MIHGLLSRGSRVQILSGAPEFKVTSGQAVYCLEVTFYSPIATPMDGGFIPCGKAQPPHTPFAFRVLMTELIQKTLRDSKAARWAVLCIVSFTIMWGVSYHAK